MMTSMHMVGTLILVNYVKYVTFIKCSYIHHRFDNRNKRTRHEQHVHTVAHMVPGSISVPHPADVNILPRDRRSTPINN